MPESVYLYCQRVREAEREKGFRIAKDIRAAMLCGTLLFSFLFLLLFAFLDSWKRKLLECSVRVEEQTRLFIEINKERERRHGNFFFFCVFF